MTGYTRARIRGLLPAALLLEKCSLENDEKPEVRSARDPRTANDMIVEAIDVRRALTSVKVDEIVRNDWVYRVLTSSRRSEFKVPGMPIACVEYEKSLVDFLNGRQ